MISALTRLAQWKNDAFSDLSEAAATRDHKPTIGGYGEWTPVSLAAVSIARVGQTANGTGSFVRGDIAANKKATVLYYRKRYSKAEPEKQGKKYKKFYLHMRFQWRIHESREKD